MIDKINEKFSTISNLATVPKKPPSELKADFDKDVNTLREKVNEVIDAVNDGTAQAEDSKKLGGKLPSYYAKQSDIPDISNKADKSEIPDISNLASKQEVSLKADKSEIPNLAPYALKTEIPDISGKADKSEIPDISGKADKSEIPSIPSNISAFTNDAGYLTQHQSLSEYAKKSEIPSTSTFATKTELNAKADKTEIPTIPSNVSAFTNDVGYLTQHQSLANYVQTNDSRLSDSRTPKAHTHTKSEISDFPTIRTSGYMIPITYNVTTSTEIQAILDAGNTPYVIYNGNTYYYQDISYDNYYRFVSITPGSSNTSDPPITKRLYKAKGTNVGGWGSGSITLYSTTHKPAWGDITGKPTIPTVPTNVSAFTNDAGYLTEHQSLANYVTTSDSRLTDSRTPKAHTHTKSEITDFPEISGGMTPIIVDLDNDDTTYASGVWTYTGLTSWDDVPDGQIFIMPIKTSDSSAKQLKIGSTSKSIYRYGTSTVTNHYGTGVIVCFYSAKKSALYVSDYDSNTNYYNYVSTTSASTVAKVIQNPLGATYVPVVGELFPVYISVTNTANNPTCQSKPIFVEGVKITTTNKGDLLRGSWMAYLASDGLYLTHNGLPQKYLDTLDLGGADVESLTTTEVNTLWSEA